MDTNYQHTLGYSTRDALIKLRDDIRSVIEEHKRENPFRLSIIKNIISFSSEKVLLSGVAYTVTLVYIICLILTYILGKSAQAHSYLLWEALFLFVILVVNFAVALNEEYLYLNEIPYRVKKVLETLDGAIDTAVWRKEHYPHLCAPFSPCVILQWTYRDGEIVNLPWALLVEGDVVVLRPGQEAPGRCRPLQGGAELQQGHMFRPHCQAKEQFTSPRVRRPHENKAYVMVETPYLRNLRLALNRACSRPNTVFEKQRYLCTVKIMEGIALPLVISAALLAVVARHWRGVPGGAGWSEVYLLQVVGASLPLLQSVFPVACVALNCLGLARFKLLSETRQKYVRPKSCSLSEDASDPLISALSESSLQVEGLRTLGRTFWRVLTGTEDMVCRTANIVHVLGSLSALCCVDKKGILSWPNPTAEKVFLLRSADREPAPPPPQRRGSAGGSETGVQPPPPPPDQPNTVAEVLDLTHEQNAPFRVEWDDCGWARHLAALRPLGLAALLNTCAAAPRHLYGTFCAHLTCEASYSEDLVPVTNRRCLCELARQIGFTDTATTPYSVEECLAVFRHLQPDTIRRETRFARSLQLRTRVKVPLPHMLAVLVRDQAHQMHMLTQGTADIIVDSCVDYWSGSELVALSPADRKKIIDFYQRSSLTAYCTAFAYKPLTRGIAPSLSNLYLELPADSRQLYEPLSQQWADTPALHFHSTDSLLFNEVTDDDVTDAEGYFDLQCNQVFIGMVTMQYQAQSDMVELIERLERACVRFVHFSKENELRSRVFSEKMGLESGWNCHISLSSDDTSKGASPLSSQTLGQTRARAYTTSQSKLNRRCEPHLFYHSSNLTSSKALSMSAPGAINYTMDHTTVKFDSEIKKARHSITTGTSIKCGIRRGSSIPTPTCGARPSPPAGDSGAPSPSPPGSPSPSPSPSPPTAGRSLSCLTDSTEHSTAPLNFDMSNRAKLPRGIENIRPHIEQVDNVPLLVSLFTDCNARSVQLMIQIMQDYGEVVCVMGSAANCLNMEIFMQADASIAVEPLYPVVCQKLPPYDSPQHGVGPVSLARHLNSLPCSLSRERSVAGDVSLFALITLSRHFTVSLWNTTQFWMCAVCFLALLQMALFVFWCYACKFLPALALTAALYGLTLRSFCDQISLHTNATDCWLVYPVNKGVPGSEVTQSRDLSLASWHGWADHFYDGYFLAQHIALATISAHLIVISISFVHRHQSIWQRGFWTNRVWCAAVLLLIILQAVFSGTLLSGTYGVCEVWDSCKIRYYVSPALGVCYALAPLAVFALNELIKWQEIKVDARNQRRARLDFGTKLGMNSPF